MDLQYHRKERSSIAPLRAAFEPHSKILTSAWESTAKAAASTDLGSEAPGTRRAGDWGGKAVKKHVVEGETGPLDTSIWTTKLISSSITGERKDRSDPGFALSSHDSLGLCCDDYSCGKLRRKLKSNPRTKRRRPCLNQCAKTIKNACEPAIKNNSW